MADWANVNALLKAYQSDLTKKATNLNKFYSQVQPPSPANSGGLSTPINWADSGAQSPGVANRGGPSVVSKIIDIISRPGYAVSEAARQGIIDDPTDTNRWDNAAQGLWEGFSGKKKTRFSQFYDELDYQSERKKIANSSDPKALVDKSRFTDIFKNLGTLDPESLKRPDKGEGDPVNAILGLATDVTTDPLNFVGGPIAKGIGKLGGLSSKLVTGSEDISKLDIPEALPYIDPTSRPFNLASSPINAPSATAVPQSFFVGQKTNPIVKAFSTSAYNRTLRPQVLSAVQGAKARAISRATVLNKIAKDFTPAEQAQAFKIGQGQLPRVSPTGSPIDELGDGFSKSINDLLTTSDMRKYATLANNGIRSTKKEMIDEVNTQLRMHGEEFQFSTKVTDPATGATVDLSRKNDWLQAWRYHDFKDPLTFTSKLSHAIENVTAKNQFLDEFAQKFGSTNHVPSRGINPTSGKVTLAHNAGIRNKRLKGLYFDEAIAKQANHLLKNWDQISNPKSNFIKTVDEVTSLWKTGVTIYAPSHHIRNLVGDTYFNWMDGVNTIRPYKIAAKVLQTQRNRYGGLGIAGGANVSDLTGKTAMANAAANPGHVAFTSKGGIPFTYEQLYTSAYGKGLLQSANTVEDITDRIVDLKHLSNPVLRRIANPAGGKISDKVRAGSELREHYVKLAHFADVLKKSKAKTFEQAVEESASRVRKWHPDGLDLTSVERNYARRVMPFYSWSRKAIPLIVESTVAKPAKAVFYPRFMQMIQDATGTAGNDISDPFPEDQLFPDWIKEKGIGPVSYHSMGGLPDLLTSGARSGHNQAGEKAGYNVVNPSNPLIDTVAQLGGMGTLSDTRSGIASMINPLFRVPAEVGTEHTVLGTPTGYDPAGYTAQQIPFLSYLSTIANTTPFGNTARGEKEGNMNWEGLINFMTALGLKGTGANTKQAEFEAKERAKQAMGG